MILDKPTGIFFYLPANFPVKHGWTWHMEYNSGIDLKSEVLSTVGLNYVNLLTVF